MDDVVINSNSYIIFWKMIILHIVFIKPVIYLRVICKISTLGISSNAILSLDQRSGNAQVVIGYQGETQLY